MEQINNANLPVRNEATIFGAGKHDYDGPSVVPPGGLHSFPGDSPSDPPCECGGAGYYLCNRASYGVHNYLAPEGRLLLTYCGLCDAPEDEQIIAAYGMGRDEAFDIDKWGVIVVEPRPEHAHLCR